VRAPAKDRACMRRKRRPANSCKCSIYFTDVQ